MTDHRDDHSVAHLADLAFGMVAPKTGARPRFAASALLTTVYKRPRDAGAELDRGDVARILRAEVALERARARGKAIAARGGAR